MKTEPVFSKRSFFAASLGTMVEYYDYAIFGLFLPLIAPLFFPGETVYDSLEKGFYAILIATIARPLGGLFFGYIGDTFGRRKALMSSMYGIAIATILMGLTPGYAEIGLWAGVMITATKSVQVFCFGGEYNGAGIYVVEHAHQKNEAFIGSCLTAVTLAGSLIATLIGFITTLKGMPTWSWRAAFVFGGVVGIIGIIYRKGLAESPYFKEADPHTEGLKALIKKFPYQLLAGFFIGGFATVPFTTVLTFMNPVLMAKEMISSQTLMLLQSLLILIAMITLLISGKIADKTKSYAVMLYAAIMLALLSFPLLWIVDQGILSLIIGVQIVLVIITEILFGPSNACLKNLFPAQFRYRGASLSFTLGLSVFGGLTPVIESHLYKMTGKFSSISIWLAFVGIGTFISIRQALKQIKESSSSVSFTEVIKGK